MSFNWNVFGKGLLSGLSQQTAGLGAGAKGFNAAFGVGEDEAYKDAMSKFVGGDKNALEDLAKYNPDKALEIRLKQQEMANALEKERIQRTFNKTNEIKNAEYLVSQGVPEEEARKIAFKNQNPSQSLTPYEKTIQQEQAKNDIEIARGDEDFKKMSPSVIAALDRAETSLKSGSGLGPIAGRLTKIGFNGMGKASENYANIESANTQMNQILRAKLKATGLTGSELNSAVEANAYRYTISPTDDEGIVMQKINNFRTDVLGLGQGNKTQTNNVDLSKLSDEELLGGL